MLCWWISESSYKGSESWSRQWRTVLQIFQVNACADSSVPHVLPSCAQHEPWRSLHTLKISCPPFNWLKSAVPVTLSENWHYLVLVSSFTNTVWGWDHLLISINSAPFSGVFQTKTDLLQAFFQICSQALLQHEPNMNCTQFSFNHPASKSQYAADIYIYIKVTTFKVWLVTN